MSPLAAVTVLLCGVVAFTLWRRSRISSLQKAFDNIPGPASTSLLNGALPDAIASDGWGFHQNLVETYKEGITKLYGPLQLNYLYVFDPTALHHILLKEQHAFEETEAFLQGSRLMFGNGIFGSVGERHRAHRKLLTPVLTVTHLRTMVPLFYSIVHKVHDVLLSKVENGPKQVDVMSWMSRIAAECIGQGGLGYSFDSLDAELEDSITHPFIDATRMLGPSVSQTMAARDILVPLVVKIGTPRFRKWLVDRIPSKDIQNIKTIIEVLNREAAGIYQGKKAEVLQGAADVSDGKDLMSLLIRENMHAQGEDKLSEDELISQVLSLSFASIDTTSSALARTFWVLSQHKTEQDTLRRELRKARYENNGEDLDYDALSSLPYLDAVLRETLRLYPPASVIQRSALQDMVVPIGKPIKGVDGKQMNSVAIPKGSHILVSIFGINRSTEIWGPDALEWKPQRWLNPLPENVVDAKIPGIYSNQMTFFAGSRSCIGFKFSQLEMKLVLALLVEKFEFSPSKERTVWQMGAIASPHPNFTSKIPSLPLQVSLAPN